MVRGGKTRGWVLVRLDGICLLVPFLLQSLFCQGDTIDAVLDAKTAGAGCHVMKCLEIFVEFQTHGVVRAFFALLLRRCMLFVHSVDLHFRSL